jgi:hypothetical protein
VNLWHRMNSRIDFVSTEMLLPIKFPNNRRFYSFTILKFILKRFSSANNRPGRVY